MKKSFLSATLLILFLIFISSNSTLSARFIATKQGKREVELGRITDMEEIESMDQLMGVEEACGSGDEECMKRRINSEAHLDYIYTQRRKP